jgi:hypothetical protein
MKQHTLEKVRMAGHAKGLMMPFTGPRIQLSFSELDVHLFIGVLLSVPTELTVIVGYL